MIRLGTSSESYPSNGCRSTNPDPALKAKSCCPPRTGYPFISAILRIAVGWTLALTLSGCATAFRKSLKDDTDNQVYPATRADIEFLSEVPVGLLAIIDLPISIVTDTVFFPYDISTTVKHQTGRRKSIKALNERYRQTVATEIVERRKQAEEWLNEQSWLPFDSTRANIAPHHGKFVPALSHFKNHSNPNDVIPPYGWTDHRRFGSYRPSGRLEGSAQGFVSKLHHLGAQQVYATSFGAPKSDAFLIRMPEIGAKRLNKLIESEASHHDLGSARTEDGQWTLIWWGLQHRQRPSRRLP